MRLRIYAALAVTAGVLLAILGGEFALRAFWPQRSSVTLGMFVADPHAGYRLVGGYENEIRVPEFRTKIRIDDDGYRVPLEAQPASEQAARLLAIGDSFTFGVGVSAAEAFPHALEAKLNREAGSSWSVRNGGVGGYGPWRSWRLFESHQAAWKPEFVVHALYLGNDLEDSRPSRTLVEPQIRDGRMVRASRSKWDQVRFHLRIHSHLYSFVRQKMYDVYQASPLAERSHYLDPMGLKEWPAHVTDETWPAAQRAIREIEAWCRKNETPYLVVLIPSRYQVEDGSWERYQKLWGLADSAFDRDRPQRVVLEFLGRHGIPALDLLPTMREATRQGDALYYRYDRHWTSEGHAFAVDQILGAMRDRGWIHRATHSRGAVVSAPPGTEAG